ncbi:phosphoribosyltransferase domain-containing protein [Streptomyces luomodiensis]|uniref:Phosphoribosyltransferase domain-containing protein n=1 Tax=Streptomyces luomodiensis TaxID=3026192 RepID=A0ABY9V9F3_9ACTN|nr:phosphoribosyltransferase domain-containing protein [Streptomyces sp. SCA4-21]WNF01542.1 phosphoribosyltransferase domain-containing protein [Streptomyces sp. SCA4-21]
MGELLGLRELLGLALRRNPKRAHLLVSNVLGKHVPQRPATVYGMGVRLGHRVRELLGDEAAARAVVLGYAETATGLGHSVADGLALAPYLHSTRRPVPGVATVGGFEEEHSHATSHLLLPEDPGLLSSEGPLVLVDDEFSTGRTILNTIAALHRRFPRDHYVVVALVDMRSPEDRARLDAFAADLGARVDLVAAAAGAVHLPEDVLERGASLVAEYESDADTAGGGAPAPTAPPSGAAPTTPLVSAGVAADAEAVSAGVASDGGVVPAGVVSATPLVSAGVAADAEAVPAGVASDGEAAPAGVASDEGAVPTGVVPTTPPVPAGVPADAEAVPAGVASDGGVLPAGVVSATPLVSAGVAADAEAVSAGVASDEGAVPAGVIPTTPSVPVASGADAGGGAARGGVSAASADGARPAPGVAADRTPPAEAGRPVSGAPAPAPVGERQENAGLAAAQERTGLPAVVRVDLGWPEGLPDGGRHGFTPCHRARLEAALPAMAARVADALATAPRDAAAGDPAALAYGAPPAAGRHVVSDGAAVPLDGAPAEPKGPVAPDVQAAPAEADAPATTATAAGGQDGRPAAFPGGPATPDTPAGPGGGVRATARPRPPYPSRPSRPSRRVLVLGFEELMYAPLRIAEALDDVLDGAEVRYSTTTRSPVLAVDDPGYAIRTRLTFPAHDEPADGPGPRYAYNVAPGADPERRFDAVVAVVDSVADTPALHAPGGLLDGLRAQTDRLVLAVVPSYRPQTPPAPSTPSTAPAPPTPRTVSQRQAPPMHQPSHEPLRGPEFSSYAPDEVGWLLQDLSRVTLEAPTEEREEAIQSGGAHYAESLPVEYQPSERYQELFRSALDASAARIARAVGAVTETVLAERSPRPVLVSLARAGTPVGVLMRRWARHAHGLDLPHYAISIVRGRGIDTAALRWLADHHDPADVVFVDGWTGKGAITRELSDALAPYPDFDPRIAVLADPGHCVDTYGTRDDFLVPSACLNSTVSGLISRTVLRADLVGPNDFHGAKYYRELAGSDVSGDFLDTVSARFAEVAEAAVADARRLAATDRTPTWAGWAAVERISQEYGIHDVNLVKPGVGETTRVLLRRVPWKILARRGAGADLDHVRLLADQRGVPVEETDGLPYTCVGLIHPRYTRGATGADGKAVGNKGIKANGKPNGETNGKANGNADNADEGTVAAR